jgi:hypothetical protein
MHTKETRKEYGNYVLHTFVNFVKTLKDKWLEIKNKDKTTKITRSNMKN